MPEKVDVQARGSVPSKPKQKTMVEKTAPLPSKRKMVPILNEEEIDNNLVESPKTWKVEIIDFSEEEEGEIQRVNLIRFLLN